MSPSLYSNVIGGLCHSLTVPLRSKQGEATERCCHVGRLWSVGSHLTIANNNAATGHAGISAWGWSREPPWWRKSSITFDFTRLPITTEESVPSVDLLKVELQWGQSSSCKIAPASTLWLPPEGQTCLGFGAFSLSCWWINAPRGRKKS